MTSDARSHSMYVLFRLSLDSTIDADGNMSSVLETALTGIEGSIPEAEFEKDVGTLIGASETTADRVLASYHAQFRLWPNRGSTIPSSTPESNPCVYHPLESHPSKTGFIVLLPEPIIPIQISPRPRQLPCNHSPSSKTRVQNCGHDRLHAPRSFHFHPRYRA